MAGGTVSSGTSSFSGSITTTGTAEETTFADRYGYVSVANTGSSVIYATANGVAPAAAPGAGSGVGIPPGTTALLSNGLPLWFQSSKVILAGSAQIPLGGGSYESTSTTVTSTPANPGHEKPFMSAGAGQMANPGTAVFIVGTAAGTYTINGAG